MDRGCPEGRAEGALRPRVRERPAEDARRHGRRGGQGGRRGGQRQRRRGKPGAAVQGALAGRVRHADATVAVAVAQRRRGARGAGARRRMLAARSERQQVGRVAVRAVLRALRCRAVKRVKGSAFFVTACGKQTARN